MEGFGFTRKIKFWIKKNRGNIENTQMTEEFQAQRTNYKDYRDALTQLTNAVETVVQPSHKYREGPKGGEAEKLEAHVAMHALSDRIHSYVKFKKDIMKKGKAKEVDVAMPHLENAGSAVSKSIKVIKKHQAAMTAAVHPLREFHNHFKHEFEKKMQEFDTAKDCMDLAKYEVQQSKTTVEIEKKAVTYKRAVETFDSYCSEAIRELATLPEIQKVHGRQLMTVWSTHRAFQHKMAKTLKGLK